MRLVFVDDCDSCVVDSLAATTGLRVDADAERPDDKQHHRHVFDELAGALWFPTTRC